MSSKLKGEIFRPLANWQFDLQIENGNLVLKSVGGRGQNPQILRSQLSDAESMILISGLLGKWKKGMGGKSTSDLYADLFINCNLRKIYAESG